MQIRVCEIHLFRFADYDKSEKKRDKKNRYICITSNINSSYFSTSIFAEVIPCRTISWYENNELHIFRERVFNFDS